MSVQSAPSAPNLTVAARLPRLSWLAVYVVSTLLVFFLIDLPRSLFWTSWVIRNPSWHYVPGDACAVVAIAMLWLSTSIAKRPVEVVSSYVVNAMFIGTWLYWNATGAFPPILVYLGFPSRM